MTLLELRAECTRVRAVRAECGLDPDTAHVILVVPRIARGYRMRVAPGLQGRPVGIDSAGRSTIVDCDVRDVEKWLAKHEDGRLEVRRIAPR